MSVDSSGKASTATEKAKNPNAERVTLIALDFLKRLGNKRDLKPEKVSLQGERYVAEIKVKKRTAIVQIDRTTEEIKEYEIKSETEEAPSFSPLSPKTLLIICGIVILLYIVLSLLGVQSFLGNLFRI
jgi:hypothetical protein